MRKNIYEEKSINSLILTFSIPAIVSLIIEMLTSVIDTIYAGHMGEHSFEALSAMGLISPLLAVFTALQTLFAVSTAIMLAKYLNDKEMQNQYFFIGFTMTCVMAAISSLIFFIFLEPIVIKLGATGQVYVFAKQYLQIQLMSNIFSSMGYTLTGCIRAFGFPKIEAYIIVLAVFINICANGIFVFGFSLGILGIAFGTLISETICAVIAIIWLYRKRKLFLPCKIPLKILRVSIIELLKIGFAQTFIQLLGSCTGFIVNARLLTISNFMYVAIWNVIQKVYSLLLMPIIGFSQGAQTIIAYFSGNKQYKKSKMVAGITLGYCMGFGIITTVIVWVFPEFVLMNFGLPSNSFEAGTLILKIIFSTFALTGIIYTKMTVLQVTGREVQSVIIALIRQVFAMIPLVLFLPFIFARIQVSIEPAVAIFISIPLADLITILMAETISRVSKHNKIEKI